MSSSGREPAVSRHRSSRVEHTLTTKPFTMKQTLNLESLWGRSRRWLRTSYQKQETCSVFLGCEAGHPPEGPATSPAAGFHQSITIGSFNELLATAGDKEKWREDGTERSCPKFWLDGFSRHLVMIRYFFWHPSWKSTIAKVLNPVWNWQHHYHYSPEN